MENINQELYDSLLERSNVLENEVKRIVRTEKKLYHIQANYDREINRLQKLTALIYNINSLYDYDNIASIVCKSLVSDFDLQKSIILFEKNKRFILGSYSGYATGVIEERLDTINALIYKDILEKILVGNNIIFSINNEEYKEIKSTVEVEHIVISSLIKKENNNDKIIGIMIAGISKEKLSLYPTLSIENTNILSNLSLQVAMVIDNVRLIENLRDKEQIEKLHQQKAVFFINLAHESKTPLTIIQNSLEEYIRKTEFTQDLKEIKYNIDLLLKNMVNFLDSEKLQKGQMFYNHDEIFLFSEFLSRKLPLFEASVKKKRINLAYNISPNISIRADSLAIDRIVNNLLDNAIKYTKEEGSIEVNLKTEDNNTIFTVRDSGEGITKENLQAIFNPYYQISHKKRNIQGIGMGLFIVSEIVKSLSGKILVESREGKGSSFTLTLPRAILKDGETVKEAAGLSVPLAQPDYEEIENPEKTDPYQNTILIVEDNISLLLQLRKNFLPLYNVFCAKNGREALEILDKSQNPDLIVADIMMDEMDGYELMEHLKQNEERKGIPFLFLTAKTASTENIQGLKSGAIDYIYKPFSMEILSAKVEALIQYQKLKKALFESDKSANLGKFSAGITHEILNPLSGIKGPIDFLHGEYEKSVLPRQADIDQAFKYVYENISRIERIVKDLRVLIYNRPFVKEGIRLKETIESLIRIVNRNYKERIEFVINIPEGLVFQTNVTAFTHIIINLINNAIDSISGKGKISISASGDKGRYSIEISDTGTGIESKHLSKIFDADFSTKGITKGTGFGLYLVSELCSRLGIHISVESEVGKGTTFVIHN